MGPNPAMVTSFADGSKISFEQAIVANATGFKVQARGCREGSSTTVRSWRSPRCTTSTRFASSGASSITRSDRPRSRSSVSPNTPIQSSAGTWSSTNSAKGRSTPSIPYHLPHFETPNAIARVALLDDNVAPPLAGPVVEVCAVAKRDLKADEVLDEYGMYMTYGEATNVDEMSAGHYLPEGLVEGCRLRGT